jgi:hypothetical protein
LQRAARHQAELGPVAAADQHQRVTQQLLLQAERCQAGRRVDELLHLGAPKRQQMHQVDVPRDGALFRPGDPTLGDQQSLNTRDREAKMYRRAPRTIWATILPPRLNRRSCSTFRRLYGPRAWTTHNFTFLCS